MKKIYLLFFILLSLHAETIKFHVLASPDIFHSETLAQEFNKKYGTGKDFLGIVLIEAEGYKTNFVTAQVKEIVEGIVIVYSFTKQKAVNDYHLPISEAQKIAGHHKGFRVTILNGKGEVIKRSSKVISEEEILKTLKSTIL